ncbi:MAG: tyrosinase family protein [Lewinellaceae bacterium]|nr:tyrosinase family protein [Lewinellaceae bacterium]
MIICPRQVFQRCTEAKYHDHGHTVVGGVMNEQFAPDAILFWPWHAWIDDLWYIWERDCGNFSQPYNFPLASGALPPNSTERPLPGQAPCT